MAQSKARMPLPPGTKLAKGATVTLPKAQARRAQARTAPVSRPKRGTTTKPSQQYVLPLDRPNTGARASRRSFARGMLGDGYKRQPATDVQVAVEHALFRRKLQEKEASAKP